MTRGPHPPAEAEWHSRNCSRSEQGVVADRCSRGSAGTSATTRAAAGGRDATSRAVSRPRALAPSGNRAVWGMSPATTIQETLRATDQALTRARPSPRRPATPGPTRGLTCPPRAPRCRVCRCCHRQRGGGQAISSAAHAAGSSTPPFTSETSFGRLRTVPRPDYEPLSIPPMRNRLAGWLRFDRDTALPRRCCATTPRPAATIPYHCT